MNTCMRTLVVITAIAALFLVSNSAFGQDSLYIDSSGKVGIGTDTPGYKLDVAGNINTNNFLYINSWPGYGNGYFRMWHDGDGGRGTPAGEQKTVIDVGNKTDVLSLDNDGNVYIKHGNVGIGVENPAEKLEVEGNVFPEGDGDHDLGSLTRRWKEIYGTNQHIQTSDERIKDKIKDIPLGLDFIDQLRPISYKWKDYYVPEIKETRTVKRQKTRRITKKVYKKDIKLIRGKYVRTWIVKNQEVDEPIFEEHPLYDENDVAVGVHKFPVMESVDEEVIIQKERDKKFTRTHYGLSAQQVKAAMDSYGVDFDGIVYDEDNDTYGIRMGEFVPILIKAVQELKAEVDQLKAEISELKK